MAKPTIDLMDFKEAIYDYPKFGQDKLFALVEAVEAAQAVKNSFPFLNGTPDEDFGGVWIPFVAALARFAPAVPPEQPA